MNTLCIFCLKTSAKYAFGHYDSTYDKTCCNRVCQKCVDKHAVEYSATSEERIKEGNRTVHARCQECQHLILMSWASLYCRLIWIGWLGKPAPARHNCLEIEASIADYKLRREKIMQSISAAAKQDFS